MSDYLPCDIWSKILLQLPIKCLVRCTTVCKSWKSIIHNPYFIYAHLSLSKYHSLFRRYDELDHYLPLQLEPNKSGCNNSINLFPDVNHPFDCYDMHRFVGSCDGILCFRETFWRILLWNPSVWNHVVLPQSQAIINPNKPQIILLGFGVANRVYKVVRLVYSWASYKGFGVGFAPPQAEVFSIGTERWRSVQGCDIKHGVSDLTWCEVQVFVNGIIHWLGIEQIGNGVEADSILTFDIGDEVFGKVQLPDVLVRKGNLLLQKIGGSLAVCGYRSHLVYGDCCVWVMKEYGVKESWTKLYNIGLAEEYNNDESFLSIFGFKNGEALLLYEIDEPPFPYTYISYNLETGETKDLGTSGIPWLFYIDDYVESLLLLKGNSVPCGEEIGELDTNRENERNGQKIEKEETEVSLGAINPVAMKVKAFKEDAH